MANPRLFSEYIPAKGPQINNLKVEVYYSLGGTNWFTYKNEPRGYYLSVTPVDRSDRGGYMCESTTLGRGVKKLVKEVSRQSKKAAEEAIILAKACKNDLIQYVCRTEGIEVIA